MFRTGDQGDSISPQTMGDSSSTASDESKYCPQPDGRIRAAIRHRRGRLSVASSGESHHSEVVKEVSIVARWCLYHWGRGRREQQSLPMCVVTTAVGEWKKCASEV
ncbi:hypothetical protein CC2G_008048 [Coprinopsis cinerea AmutBmut pab1-1]|nr:hypothetical protein CC2G_008048 [Coprinopsis cinerea AmutBmut pab1-1]